MTEDQSRLDEVRALLIEAGVPEDKIDEMELSLKDKSHSPLPSGMAYDEVPLLKLQMDQETDWIKKSVIAARIASIHLSTD